MPANATRTKTSNLNIPANGNTVADLRALIEAQGKQIAELQTLTEKVYNYLWWQRVGYVVKLLLIIVPLILGIIYLPPLLSQIINPYQAVLDSSSDANGNVNYVSEWQKYIHDLSQ